MWNNGSYDAGRPRRSGQHRARHHVGGDQADHAGAQPGQRHAVTVQPPGGRPVLRAGQGRHPADHQPRRSERQPAGGGNTPAPPPHSHGWGFYDPWVWTSWLPMIEPSAARIPWMFATGNHDPELFSAQRRRRPRDRRHLRAARLRRPREAARPADDRTVGLPVGLQLPLRQRRHHQPRRQRAVLGDPGPHRLQRRRAGRDGWRNGSRAGARDPAVDFIVAFFHECAFSTCNGHSSDGGVRSTLAPLFARYQVDLAVQGHNHVYERTNPLLYDPATNTARSTKQAVAISPERAGRGRAGQGRHHLRGRRHRGHAPLRLDRRARDRPQLRRRAGQRHGRSPRTRGQEGPWVAELDFSKTYETVDWSQARYDDYGFIALDVTPGAARAADHDDAAVHQRAGPGA